MELVNSNNTSHSRMVTINLMCKEVKKIVGTEANHY
jgi:hypothetical protein